MRTADTAMSYFLDRARIRNFTEGTKRKKLDDGKDPIRDNDPPDHKLPSTLVL